MANLPVSREPPNALSCTRIRGLPNANLKETKLKLGVQTLLILTEDRKLGYPTVEQLIDDILATRRATEFGDVIGRSRAGRPIQAARLGCGERRVSLIGGCHADEPVGPRLLRHLISYLRAQPAESPILRDYQWWIIPHINPDGEVVNQAWYE